jgi:hypothetical protein
VQSINGQNRARRYQIPKYCTGIWKPAVRELSSSLREWKKGIGGQILTRLNELEYRVDDIEYERDHQSPYGKSLQQWEDSK